jgi:hypothetical protein
MAAGLDQISDPGARDFRLDARPAVTRSSFRGITPQKDERVRLAGANGPARFAHRRYC